VWFYVVGKGLRDWIRAAAAEHHDVAGADDVADIQTTKAGHCCGLLAMDKTKSIIISNPDGNLADVVRP
jgi:hypothetical protein